MTKEELIEAANRPVTEKDLDEYKAWRKKCEKEFARVQKMHNSPSNWQEGK